MGERRVGPQGTRKGTTLAGALIVGLAPVQRRGRNERRQKRIEDREHERFPLEPYSLMVWGPLRLRD